MKNLDLEKRIILLEEKVKKIEGMFSVGTDTKNGITQSTRKKISIKEFLIQKKADDDVKRTLTIGYFLENMENMQFFNVDDIKKSFALAKLPAPSNINDKINMNIKNGHIMEVEEKKDSKKAWVLTVSGENFVKNDFEK